MKSIIYSLSNIGTKLLLYPIAFFASMVIARYLGPEEKGIYAFIIILLGFLIPFLSLGFGGGVVYNVSNKKYTPEQVWYTVLVISIGAGLVNILALSLAWYFGWLGEMNDNFSSVQIILLGLILIFNSIFFFMSRMAKGDSRFHLLNFIDVGKTILNPVLMITLVYFFSLRINGVIYGLILLNGILATILSWQLYKRYQPRLKFRKDFVKDCFSYGLKGWLGDIAVRANIRLDQLILGGVVAAGSLGIYSVGVVLAEMLWLIPDSIGSVLFNRIAIEKNPNVKVALAEQVHRLLFSISVLIAITWGVLCVFVVIPYGYGTDYIESIIPFMILVPGAILYIPAKVMTKLMSGSGRILDTSKATAIGSAISIILYFLLIPRYGIVGAAVASTVGYIAVSVSCLYFARKHFGIALSRLIVPTGNDLQWIKTQSTNLLAMIRKR